VLFRSEDGAMQYKVFQKIKQRFYLLKEIFGEEP